MNEIESQRVVALLPRQGQRATRIARVTCTRSGYRLPGVRPLPAVGEEVRRRFAEEQRERIEKEYDGKPAPIQCIGCDKRLKTPGKLSLEAWAPGWRRRAVVIDGTRFVELHCPDCFREWGWGDITEQGLQEVATC